MNISKRDLKIAYEVDGKNIKTLANEYSIPAKQMKEVLKECGISIKRGDDTKEELNKIKINLVD